MWFLSLALQREVVKVRKTLSRRLPWLLLSCIFKLNFVALWYDGLLVLGCIWLPPKLRPRQKYGADFGRLTCGRCWRQNELEKGWQGCGCRRCDFDPNRRQKYGAGGVPWCGKVWLPSKCALNIKENCLIVPFLYNCYLFVCLFHLPEIH